MNQFFANHLNTLERTERASPNALVRYQRELVELVARHAFDNAPFYRDRLACLFDAAGSFQPSRWREVPILSRSDAVTHTEAMRATSELPESRFGAIAEFTTSGSTGEPLKVLLNGLVSLSSNALLARMARWFDMDASRTLAMIRIGADEPATAYPNGKRINAGWIVGVPGTQFQLNAGATVAQQVEWLGRLKAPYLMTQPSSAIAIADFVSPEEGRRLGVEVVISVGETAPAGFGELMAERLGARLAPFYACQEVGMLATACPQAQHYHLAVENALVEIVDDSGVPVPPGQRGRVVVTGLYNYAMPFIRYDLGDVAVAELNPCPCGRTLPVLTRIEGRQRSAFTFEDGTQMWPRSVLVHQMHAFVPFRRYQLVQLDHRHVELRYIPDGSGRLPDVDGLSSFARRMLHPSVEIVATAMEELPKGPSGKFEDIFSLVSKPPIGTRS